MSAYKESYGPVVINTENAILPIELLVETPSFQQGIDELTETDLRIYGCELIQVSGMLLKLPQVAMATGQVIFQRFYYRRSFLDYRVETFAAACIFLAAKIEECDRRLKDVVNVSHHLEQKMRNKKPIALGLFSEENHEYRSRIIKAERQILKDLGFCVHVQHPHKLIISFLHVLELNDNREITQLAWNYMNDSLRTNVFVRFSSEVVACATINLSARDLQVPLPQNPPWWELFDVKLREMEAVCQAILFLYKCTDYRNTSQKFYQ